MGTPVHTQSIHSSYRGIPSACQLGSQLGKSPGGQISQRGRMLNLLSLNTVPFLDLSILLRALRGPPF